jgi:hypothetical protein
MVLFMVVTGVSLAIVGSNGIDRVMEVTMSEEVEVGLPMMI